MKRKMVVHEKANTRRDSGLSPPSSRMWVTFSITGSGVDVDDRTSIPPWSFDRLSLCFPTTEASQIVRPLGALPRSASRRRPSAGSLLLL